MNGKSPDKATDQDSQSYENHVSLIGRPVYITHLFGGGFHFVLHARKFEDISRIDYGLSEHWHVDTCTLDTTDADTVHELL